MYHKINEIKYMTKKVQIFYFTIHSVIWSTFGQPLLFLYYKETIEIQT